MIMHSVSPCYAIESYPIQKKTQIHISNSRENIGVSGGAPHSTKGAGFVVVASRQGS
jgi:hypothetical protein